MNMKNITQKIKRAVAKTIGIIGLAVGLSLGGQAEAQGIEYVAGLNGGTNRILLATSNIYTATIPVAYSREVFIQCSFKMTGAGATSNVWFYLDSSVDNSVWLPQTHVLGKAANGVSEVVMQTNITVGAQPYLRLSSIYNTNTIAVTNLTFRYSTKRGL